MPHAPRPYQSAAIASLRANFARGTRRQLLVAPTGAGKTTIAAIVIDGAIRKQKRAWFLAHRRELINQCSARLDDHGIPHGVIQGTHPRFRPWLPVQVVSVHTIVRGRRLEAADAPDLIIVDEAHRSLAQSYLTVIERFPDAAVIGLTATPWRLDGKPLGDRYEELVVVATPRELIDLGYLLAPRVFAPNKPDLSGVKKVGGDYKNDQLADRMKTATIVGDVVRHWRTHIESSPNPLTVLFAVNKAHSLMMRDRFREEGIAAAHIDESSTVRERDEILRDLASGTIKVVCNCQILTEGWDLPQLGCVELLRPTKSLALYLQMAGRGMRTHVDKSGWTLMDHAGCVLEHDFPQAEREYSLERPATKPKGEKSESGPPVTVCEICFAIFESALRACPACGHERTVEERKIKEDKDGKLAEMTPDMLAKMRRKAARKIPWAKRERHLLDLMVEADRHNYKPGWAMFRFKEEIGQWPPKAMEKAARVRAERVIHERRANQPDSAFAGAESRGRPSVPAERGEASGSQRTLDSVWGARDG